MRGRGGRGEGVVSGKRVKKNLMTDFRYPVLHLFLTQEEQLRSLRYLRSVLEWQKILSLRFDKRIDRETARTQTVGEMLESLPVGYAIC